MLFHKGLSLRCSGMILFAGMGLFLGSAQTLQAQSSSYFYYSNPRTGISYSQGAVYGRGYYWGGFGYSNQGRSYSNYYGYGAPGAYYSPGYQYGRPGDGYRR